MRLITLLIVLSWISAFTANRADAESVLLKREGGVFVLPVQVNDRITLDFTIDSGAADVVIPADVFSTLSRTGTISSKDMMDSRVYELADGSRQEARRFRIRSLKIGNLELRNIVGSVTPAGGTLLLGQSFLSHLPSWSIDNRHGLLVIADAGSHGESQSSAPDSPDSSTLSSTVQGQPASAEEPWRQEELNEHFMRSLTKAQCMTKAVAALMAGCSSAQCLKGLAGATGDCVTWARGDTASFCAGYEREYIATYCATKQPDHQRCKFLTVAESTLCAASVAPASATDGLFSYGDWRSNIVPNENGWTLASTKNDNGEFLSKYCQVNNACLWRIDVSGGPCNKNDQSQVFINGGGGMLKGSTVTCLGKVNENWVWRIEDQSAIENVLKRSTAVTITFPLDDGVHLREIGFSGRGAVKATATIGAPIVGEQRQRTQDVTY